MTQARTSYRFFLTTLVLGAIVSCTPDRSICDDLFDLDLEELSERTVGSGSKRAHGSPETPASVEIISSEEIQRFGFRKLTDVLRRVPGLYSFSDRNYEYLGVRGFAEPSGFNTRVLIMVDGHKLNEPNFDYVGVGEDLHVDMEHVERIEIIKGPVSAVWGTNALLGVVNVITKQGRNIAGTRVVGEFGSHDRSKGIIETGRLLKSGFEYSAGASIMGSDGENRIFFPELASPEFNGGVAEGADDESAYRGFAKLARGPWSFLVGHGSRRKVDPAARYETLFNSDENSTVDSQTFVDLKYDTQLSGDVNSWVTARAYYDRARYYADFQNLERIRGRESADNRGAGFEASYTQQISERVSGLVGGEVFHAWDVERKGFTLDPVYEPYRVTEDELTIASAYGELSYNPVPPLEIVTSVRFDRYSTVGGQWSPRVGFIYVHEHETKLKLVLSDAHRAPSLNEFFRVKDDDVFSTRALDLDEERMRSVEAIVERTWREFFARASVFWHHLDDQIAFPAGQTGGGDPVNNGELRSAGIDLSTEYWGTTGLLAHASLTLMEADDLAHRSDAPNAPHVLGKAGVSFPLFDRRILVGPDLEYIGERRDLLGRDVGDSTTVNLTVLARDFGPQATVSLTVYNLLNDTRYHPASREHTQRVLPDEGRSLRLQAAWRF